MSIFSALRHFKPIGSDTVMASPLVFQGGLFGGLFSRQTNPRKSDTKAAENTPQPTPNPTSQPTAPKRSGEATSDSTKKQSTHTTKKEQDESWDTEQVPTHATESNTTYAYSELTPASERESLLSGAEVRFIEPIIQTENITQLLHTLFTNPWSDYVLMEQKFVDLLIVNDFAQYRKSAACLIPFACRTHSRA